MKAVEDLTHGFTTDLVMKKTMSRTDLFPGKVVGSIVRSTQVKDKIFAGCVKVDFADTDVDRVLTDAQAELLMVEEDVVKKKEKLNALQRELKCERERLSADEQHLVKLVDFISQAKEEQSRRSVSRSWTSSSISSSRRSVLDRF